METVLGLRVFFTTFLVILSSHLALTVVLNETEIVEQPEIPIQSNVDWDLNEYRYHENDKKYYKVGSTEPCGENMRFFAVPDDSKLGRCDCDYYDCSRPLLFNTKSGQCHWAWSRGPCEEGEWYTYGEKMLPSCQKNSCPESLAVSSVNYYFKNPTDGQCYEAGTKGYCEESTEKLMTYPDEPIPVCRNYTVCYPLSLPAQQLCIQGNWRHHQGHCEF